MNLVDERGIKYNLFNQYFGGSLDVVCNYYIFYFYCSFFRQRNCWDKETFTKYCITLIIYIYIYIKIQILNSFVFLQLIGVDVIAGLDMYMEQGDWEKCIQEAEQQVCTILLFFLIVFAEEKVKVPTNSGKLA